LNKKEELIDAEEMITQELNLNKPNCFILKLQAIEQKNFYIKGSLTPPAG